MGSMPNNGPSPPGRLEAFAGEHGTAVQGGQMGLPRGDKAFALEVLWRDMRHFPQTSGNLPPAAGNQRFHPWDKPKK